MKKVMIAAMLIAGATSHAIKKEIKIPKDAKKFGSSHYKVFSGATTWFAARSKCEKLGGHLVYIESPEEHKFIRKMLYSKCVWVGAMQKGKTFQWGNGEDFSNLQHGAIIGYYTKNKKRQYAAINRFGDFNARPSSGTEKTFPVKKIQGYLCEWETPAE